LKSALLEDFKEPKRHVAGALDDALIQRIIKELKSDHSISGKKQRK